MRTPVKRKEITMTRYLRMLDDCSWSLLRRRAYPLERPPKLYKSNIPQEKHSFNNTSARVALTGSSNREPNCRSKNKKWERLYRTLSLRTDQKTTSLNQVFRMKTWKMKSHKHKMMKMTKLKNRSPMRTNNSWLRLRSLFLRISFRVKIHVIRPKNSPKASWNRS